MRLFAEKIFLVVLLMAVLLMSSYALAHEQVRSDQISSEKQELADALPGLADIIPLSTKLYGRLAVLENTITGVLNVPEVQKKYDEIEANLKVPIDQLQQLKDSKVFRYRKLVELKEEIEQENEVLEKLSAPLNESISQLGMWRKEWLAEKKLWGEWQSALLKERDLGYLKPIFAKTHENIDTALDLILPKLQEMLTVQEKAGTIQKKIKSLTAELDGMILSRKRSFLLNVSPPMFSPQYFSQFGSTLWYEAQRGIEEIQWPGKRFLDRHGWISFFQVFLSLVVIIALYRNRQVLHESDRWRFLAARPIAAGFFIAIMTTLLFYRDERMPATWEFATVLVGGVSFVLLFGCLIAASWKRHFVYGLITIFIVNKLIYVINLPFPLIRLYLVFASLASLFFCWRWARESGRHEKSGFYAVWLRLGSLLFASILITEIWGKTNLPTYLFVSLIQSATMVFVFVFFMHMIHGGVEWIFRISPLRRAAVLNADDTDAIIRAVVRFIYFVILMMILIPGVLMIWGAYGNLDMAVKGVLARGFTIGSLRISIGVLITSAGILYGSFLISWIFQKVIVDKVLVRRQIQKGARLAIGRLMHYGFILAGFLLALSTLGIEITKLTIMLSALGVGIGFGLQGVVNNFVSGLILLFERPVRVGDSIELSGKWSEIKKIGLRSTIVRTVDDADVIIPNADLISNQVTNWTLSSRRVRLIIPVGVAYGSDVSLVVETLTACAKANPMTAEKPEPQVLFLSFGESSLDFELRVWVMDVDNRLHVISDLHQEIDRRFREANIEIAFPQRDLHLRSVDESIVFRPPETT